MTQIIRVKVSFRLLLQQRDLLLEELRALAPDLVAELKLTLEELQRHERGNDN